MGFLETFKNETAKFWELTSTPEDLGKVGYKGCDAFMSGFHFNPDRTRNSPETLKRGGSVDFTIAGTYDYPTELKQIAVEI